jgi:glyoxylase-like metal-dependent hydrolase (beta-lactamase superfamily II)
MTFRYLHRSARCAQEVTNMGRISIVRFEGQEANVNAYIIHNATHAVVVDSLRNREEAAALAEAIHHSGRRLQAIFVTHGHPDHYIGSRTLKEAFPSARILVASEAIKADTLGFSKWMDSVGWLDKQPQMKPRSEAAPDGFDYGTQIEVLGDDRLVLEGGGVLEIRADYPATESGHMSTVYVPQENALLTSDLVYHGVHAWAGQGVLREHIANWVAVLGELKAKYSDPDVLVYPGHGAPSDPTLFDRMRNYLEDFVGAVSSEPTNAAALSRMKRLYPGFQQEEFLLAHSVAFHGADGRMPRPNSISSDSSGSSASDSARSAPR